jgi:2,3-bisphosphoglycerate-independent phosphoglycerate mutase
VDACLARIVEVVDRRGGICVITADHGNAEEMLETDGRSPHTAHTTNPVPVIVTDTEVTLTQGGELSDLAPTVLGFMGFTQPLQMTGRSLTTPG